MSNAVPAIQRDKWVLPYVIALKVIAALLGLSAPAYIWFGVGPHERADWALMLYFSSHATYLLAFALAPLVVAQLLSLVFGLQERPAFFLRHSLLCFAFIATVSLGTGAASAVFAAHFEANPVAIVWAAIEPARIASVLVWVAFGLVLRRVLPIIEESKSLV